MGPKTIVAIILIILGIVILAYQGITYTKRESVVNIGALHVTAEKEKTIPLPPILGAAALVAGLALLFVGNKKT
jgi:hypothetical protein